MQVTEYITSTINRFPKGYVFTYGDFPEVVDKKEAVIKALNRMVQAGKICKLSKGKYYKPEKTPFGELMPSQQQVVKDLLEENGKVVGYLTGLSIYNQLGITTQVSNVIQIGKNSVRTSFKRERYIISFVKQKNTITKENIPLLQLLDTIRTIKKIPDTSVEMACKRLLAIARGLSLEDKATMARLAMKYPPSTRALLGAMLDSLGQGAFIDKLYSSLNPVTIYQFAGVEKILDTSEKWNIR